ncbi:MAG TPA: sigma-54 dependent transcriptional regulator, partial [bacterium]|nr:sigma-54 dependent transcriptional regulator [bacterium]
PTGADALAALGEAPADLLLTDLRMPGMDGIELLRRARAADAELLIVLMTAFATVDSAVEAMKDGAFDYLQKPFTRDQLVQRVERAAERAALRRENAAFRKRLEDEAAGQILGESGAVQKLRDQLRKVAAGRADVLITGESGTGKELAARALHFLGPAAAGPFVPVNCAAIPEALAESELFGHEKGSFTGAADARAGCFERADGGTLFLDEVSSMPAALQSKLLRVLQDRVVQRVGGAKARKVDVRVIAATNRDLRAMAAGGQFREDLYHRLNVLEVHLPPLRERAGDVRLLAEWFRDRSAERCGVDPPEIRDELMRFLEAYPFTGNVRELEHLIEKMVVLSEGDPLGLGDLPPSVAKQQGPAGATAPASITPWNGSASPEDLLGGSPISLPEVEERLLREAIRQAEGNLSEAARMLGISYKTMQYRARKFGLGGR